MKPRSPRIVELFNQALTFELTVVNQYFLNARMLENWGLPKLGATFYKLSIGEMKDADDLIQRVLFFDGHPNVQKLNAIKVGESVEEILRLALASELTAVAQFNDSAAECHDLGDHASANIFEEMARDEEQHADWIEAQLTALETTGLANYAATLVQADAGI